MSNFSEKVKVFHRLNRLKLKAGVDMTDSRQGFIDPLAIHKAQQAIESRKGDYAAEAESLLVQLDSTWEDMKRETDIKKIEKLSVDLHNFSNNIKDMAETFDYMLMGYFGKSLRDFCERLDILNKAHHTIVQAHIDVMNIAFKHDIKDEGGPQGRELKAMLAKAVEKYS